MHAVVLGLVLFGVWFLWSGHSEAWLLGLGATSVLAVIATVRRMGLIDDETVPVHMTGRFFLGYAPWLAWEIVKANVSVAGRILSPGLRVEPRLIEVTAEQRSDLCRVVYGNSITLTPGTVTVDVEGDRITVHALTEDAARGLVAGDMNRRVVALEGRG